MAGDKIFEFEEKILFMAETLKELGSCASITVDGFAKATGIDRDRLRGAIENGSATSELERLLATATNFSPSDLTWKDTRIDYLRRATAPASRYPGYDTADNFRRMVRLRNGLPVLGNLSLRAARPTLTKKNLAALSVSAGQTGIEDPSIPVILHVTMNPGFHASGLTYGFRRVRLQFDFRENSTIRLMKRLGYPRAASISRGMIQGASTDFDSYWYISDDGGILSGDFVTGDAPLCELLEATIDEEFTAVLSVCPPDGDLSFRGAAKDTNAAQRAVLKSLMTEKISGSMSADGWINLGQQVLRVYRA